MGSALFIPPEEDELVDVASPASFAPPESDTFADPDYPDLVPESAAMSAVRKFKNTIAPAAGTALGAWGAGLAAGPESGFLASIPAAIAGGTAGGAGVQWAQDKLMGEEGAKRERAQVQLNELAHPWASTTGGAIPTMISLLGGGGFASKVAQKAEAKAVELGLEGLAKKAFIEKATEGTGKAVVESALTGARMGASETAQRAVQGDEVGLKDFGDAMAHDAVSFGPFGVLGHVEGLYKNLGMAVPQAYLSTIAGAAYDSMVHGKPFDVKDVAGKGTAEVVPFAIFNAISHGVSAGQKRLAKTAETAPPPPSGAEPVSGTEALHMQGFKEPVAPPAIEEELPDSIPPLPPLAEEELPDQLPPLNDAALATKEQETAQEATALAEQHAQTNAPEDREAVAAATEELADVRGEQARRSTAEVVDPVVDQNLEVNNPKTAEALAALPEKLAEQQAIESQRASAEEQAKLAEDAAKEKETEEKSEEPAPTVATEQNVPRGEEAPEPAEPITGEQNAIPERSEEEVGPHPERIEGPRREGESPGVGPIEQGIEPAKESGDHPSPEQAHAQELTGDKPWELLSFTPQTTTSHDDQQRLDALERGFANDPRTAKLGLVPRAEDARPMAGTGGTDSAGSSRGAAALASIEAFAKATGRRVIFISEKDNHPLPFNAVILPEHPDTIFINKNGERHLLALLGHEWAHTVKIADPKLHDAFQKEVLRQLGEKYKAMEEAGLKAKYPLEDLPEEVASNVAGDVFMQPEFWEKLKDHDRPLWERMVDAVGKWLNEMVTKIIKSEFGTTEAVQDIEATRQAVLDLMNGSSKEPGKIPIPFMGGIDYSKESRSPEESLRQIGKQVEKRLAADKAARIAPERFRFAWTPADDPTFDGDGRFDASWKAVRDEDAYLEQFIPLPSIYPMNDGTFTVGESLEHYKTLEDAKAAVIHEAANFMADNTGVFKANMDGQQASKDVFGAAQPFFAKFGGAWGGTKWGSWYFDAKDEDGEPLKISIRDHEATRKDMGLPDKAWEVSKEWSPKEVAEALAKAHTWLQKNAIPLSEDGAESSAKPEGAANSPADTGMTKNPQPGSGSGGTSPERPSPVNPESSPESVEPSTLNPQPSTPSWGQTVKEMREANAKGVIPAHQVTHDLDDLLSGKKKAIVLNGIKDERAAIMLGNTLGFRVAELPNHLGWIGYLEPDAWKPVYDAYAKHLMVEGEHAHLDPMAHGEIAKAMGVDQEQIDDFYRAMLKKHGLKFSADEEEDAEDDGDLGKDMTVAGIEETYREWNRKAPGGRPYMNMDDATSAAHVELLRNPEKPQELASAILSDNHKATPREKALMAVAVVQLHNIIEAHPGDPSNIALYDKLDNLYRAYRLDSSSWGQEGNVIQQRIKKDYTPAGLLRRVRMATGKEPTAEMRAKIERFAKEFAAATEQEKQDAFSYTKKVAHELMEKLEQEQKAREEEGSHWLDSALESLGEEDRGHADAVVGAIIMKNEIAKRRSKLSGLKFSAEGDGKPDEKISPSAAIRLKYADQIKMIESADVATLDKLDQQLSDTLAKAAKHFSDPTTKDAIKKAVGGDKIALKLLDDLSKQPKAKPAKAPDPVKKRFADEVRHPGDASEFAEDMKKLGVNPETAEKLHTKAKEKRETMVKRKFAKDKSSEAAGHERDEDSPLSTGEIEQALREQGVSHVSDVDASLLEEAMRTLVASGHRGEAEVIPELHKLVAKAGISGDVDEVREAAVKYGAKRRVPSPEELDTALRQVRSEAQKMAQIMHVLHHAELPSGFGPLRDKPHQKLRELYKQLKDVIKNARIPLRSSKDQLASAQDATLTRLRNDIEDLEAQIAAGKRTIRDKNPLAHSPEFLAKHEKLKARKAELQEALDSIDPKNANVAQQIAAKKRQLERVLEAATKRLVWGEKPEPGSPPISSPEIEQIKAQIAKIREAIIAIEGRPGQSPEAKLKSAEAAAERAIESLKAQIESRDFSKRAASSHVWSERLSQLRQEMGILREVKDSMKEAMKPPPDPAERERRLIAAAERVAKHWQERVKNAEWEDKKPNGEVSQAVKDARKIAANAKELFEQAKDAARPDFKVGERIDMRKKQIDSLITKARERLAFGKKQKGNGIYTPEAEASVFAEQQALIDELQRLRVEIEGKPGMSDEQRLKNAEASSQKAIDLLKNQIAANDFTAKDKKNPVGSPKLADLRQELELLREVRDAMKYKERPSDEELAIKRYSRLLERRQADLERRIRDKDFSKVERKKTPENFENEVKKLAIAKLQRRFNTMVKEEVDKNRTVAEKIYDYIPKLKRAFVLSYPAVVGKLTAAAAMRGLTTVSEELVGGALSKVLPKELVRKAEIEGSMLSASGWSKAIARWWDHVGKDVKDTVKEGSSDLDDLFGKGGHESDWWGFFGRIHAALKSPVKRLRFEMAMEKQAEAYARGGGDPTDLITNPLLAAKTGAKAYQAANRDIFLQDNILVDRYTTFVNLLAGAKGTAGPTIARGLRTLLPIVKVPTNIVLETSQHIAGVPIALARLGKIWQRGMETITPEESESIMRMMKKGSLGAGLMLLGFYAGGPNFAAGGYYSHDDKRKPGDPKVGGFKVFGMDVPTWMTHAPAFEAIQVGATFRRGLNSHQHTKSIPSAALASMVGLAEETPFLNEIFRSKYMTTAKGQEQFIGELAKAQIEPGLLSQIAQWTDRSRPLKPADLLTGEGQQKRKPNGFTEIMKSGIPGLRKGLSYTVDSPFSPREEHPPEVLHDYAQKGYPMPTTPTRAPLEKKQGRPISNDIWNAYTDIRGRAVEREMLANIGFLMAPMSEKAKKQKVMEIARKASYEATQALGLK